MNCWLSVIIYLQFKKNTCLTYQMENIDAEAQTNLGLRVSRMKN